MVKEIKHSARETVRIFTLDKPQPVKNPLYLLFPVSGTIEVKGPNGRIKAKERITIKDRMDLIRLIYKPFKEVVN